MKMAKKVTKKKKVIKEQLKIDKLGTIKYAIHNKVLSGEVSDGTIQVCKVVTYTRCNGKVYPILLRTKTGVGGLSGLGLDQTMHTIYNELWEAVHALANIKKPKDGN